LRADAERVGDDLRGDGAVALSLRRRPEADGDAGERSDRHRGALGVAGFRERTRSLVRGLGEGDVAHVRDRGLDDAREPDPDEAALGARLLLLGAPLVVAGELQ
jgi:hypothetical protein